MNTVTLTRRRHPFEGRSLRVLGSMRRHGAAELLVVLPDGSKRLIPVTWTDLEQPADGGDDGAATLGPVADLLRLSVLVSGLSARPADGPGCTEVTVQGGRPCSLFSSVCCRRSIRRHLRWFSPSCPGGR